MTEPVVVRTTRRLGLVLLLLLPFPTIAAGRPVRVGFVTTLQGAATVARSTVTEPVPLRFKDDVFVHDRIATGDESLVRILLGGKALVTVRERSVLTITEVPGRSTVQLESGKVGVAVAREKMRPGEIIDIRTANAIAAVRGTVLVVEVGGAAAPAPGAAGAVTPSGADVVTNVWVEKGQIDLIQLDPGTGTTIDQRSMGAGQAFSLPGAAPGRAIPFDGAAARAGLSAAPGIHHRRSANQAHIASQHVQMAGALMSALEAEAAADEPREAPEKPARELINSGCPPTCSPLPLPLPSGPLVTIGNSAFSLSAPLGEVTLGAVTSVPDERDHFGLTGSQGTLYAATDGGGDVFLRGGILTYSSSITSAGIPAFNVSGASYASSVTSSSTLLSTFGSSLTLGSDAFKAGTGSVLTITGPLLSSTGGSTQGPLLQSVGGFFTISGHLVEVDNSGTITRIIDTSPLLQFMGSAVTLGGTGGSLAHADNGGQMNLNGPLAWVNAAGISPWNIDGLVWSRSWGIADGIDTNGSVEPLVAFWGAPTGVHALANSTGRSMFYLEGTTAVLETDPDAIGLIVGSQRPLRHDGELSRGTNGTSVATNELRLDTALLDASRPLLTLMTGSTLTSANDLLVLAPKGKLNATLGTDALARLEASSLTVTNGSLLSLLNGSFARVTGSLVRLENGSTLNILSGSLVYVGGAARSSR